MPWSLTGTHKKSGHLLYTEQKKKRNNRPPKIFEFNGKMLIISGLLLYDSHSWDVIMQKSDFHFDKNLTRFLSSSKIMQIGKDLLCACAHF